MAVKVDRKLPSTETYACTKNDAKAALGSLPNLEVHFGQLTHFEVDRRYHHRPEISGFVVASVRVSRELDATAHFYPIRREDYSDRERGEFVATELGKLETWTRAALGVSETEVVGHRELIIESRVDGFSQHELKLL